MRTAAFSALAVQHGPAVSGARANRSFRNPGAGEGPPLCRSGRLEHAPAQQLEARAAAHRPLDRLQAADLAPTGPVLHGSASAARTAARSRASLPANLARAEPLAAASQSSYRSGRRSRTMAPNRRAKPTRYPRSGERAISASTKRRSAESSRSASATTSHAARRFGGTGHTAAAPPPDGPASALRRPLAQRWVLLR